MTQSNSQRRVHTMDPWSVHTRRLDWVDSDSAPKPPILSIAYNGNHQECQDRLEATAPQTLPSQVEVTFRLNAMKDAPIRTGVIALSNRLTSDFLMESQMRADAICRFTDAVHRFADHTGEEVTYELWIDSSDGLVMDAEKHALPIFDQEGNLCRRDSVIPPWIID